MKHQKGDLLFYKGTSPISRLVRYFTDSEYSHVAMALNEFQVFEINFNYPAGVYNLHYATGTYDVFRLKYVTEEQIDRIIEWLLEHIGARYDDAEIASFLWHKYWGWNIVNNPLFFICSSMFYSAYKANGINPFDEQEVGIVTPEVLSKNGILAKQ